MIYNRILVLFAFIFLFSCSKNKDEVSSKGRISTYFPLNIGNYWVYEHVRVDTHGVETVLDRTDSIFVSHTIWHNNKEYFVFVGERWGSPQKSDFCFCRDSLGYLVDKTGKILFASNDFKDSIYVYYETLPNSQDTIHTDVMQMKKVGKTIHVPAGSFTNVLNYHGEHKMYVSLPSNVSNPRDWNNMYAPGVGLILDNYFYSQEPQYTERRLLRFKIQQE